MNLGRLNLRYFYMALLYWCRVSAQARCNSSRVFVCWLPSLFSKYIALHALYIKHTHGFSLCFSLRSLTPLFKGTGPVPFLSSSGVAKMDAWTQWAVKSALFLSRCAWPPNISLENFTGSAFNNNLPAAGYPYELLQWQIYNLAGRLLFRLSQCDVRVENFAFA